MGKVRVRLVEGCRVVEREGKKVGVIRGKNYITWRNKIHLFRKFNGFGLSVDVIEALKSYGVENVLIVYAGDSGEVLYKSKLKDWIDSELEWIDESQGKPDKQKLLPLIQMEAG